MGFNISHAQYRRAQISELSGNRKVIVRGLAVCKHCVETVETHWFSQPSPSSPERKARVLPSADGKVKIS